MAVVIYHNPDCGTSRNVVRFAEEAGVSPTVIQYLETGWTRPQLLGLFAAADVTPIDALRRTRSPTEEMGLLAETDHDVLLGAMIAHPILVNRPFVCSPKGVMLCRPSERVFEMIDVPDGQTFYKEDGAEAFQG
ncbi:MAG: arsenate reductase family protein [Pseudomonadota bacterium]